MGEWDGDGYHERVGSEPKTWVEEAVKRIDRPKTRPNGAIVLAVVSFAVVLGWGIIVVGNALLREWWGW